MPMNMPLPTNAKMTAFVCNGRSRPNVVYCRLRFRSGQNNWQAMSRPALNPTSPQMTVAMAKARTMRLSYLNVSMFMDECCVGLESQDHVHGEPILEEALRTGDALFVGEAKIRPLAQPRAEAGAECHLGKSAGFGRTEVDQVEAFNVEGRDLGSVIEETQTKIATQVKLPTGYYIEYGGQFQSQEEANRVLLGFGSLAVFVALMLLYQAFGNFREALLVLINLPLAMIGGIASLFIFGADMSVAAVIGFITLFGIAARNGIILVTHYNQLRGEGKALDDVVMQGTLDRLVPVLMTAATAALGLIPLLWGSPVGKELERPLAQVVLGGLFTSTFLNLVVIPTLYLQIERRREAKAARIAATSTLATEGRFR